MREETTQRFTLAVPDVFTAATSIESLRLAVDKLAAKVIEQDRYLRHIVQLLGLEEENLHG